VQQHGKLVILIILPGIKKKHFVVVLGFQQKDTNSATDQLDYSNHDKFVRYEGQVRDGKPWGRGNMTFKDGGFYFGEWTDELRNGEGIQKYSE
jgi:hypothetical protein